MDAIANMIGISYKQTYEILETLFPLVTMVGYCFRFAETKEKFPDIEVKTSENNFYLEFAQLSYSEQLLARIDLALRFIMSMAPNQYWLMILGSEVMSKLNEDTRLRQVIFGLPDNIQVFCCVAGKDIVDFMISGKENVFNVTDCNEFKIYSSTEDLDANFFAGG